MKRILAILIIVLSTFSYSCGQDLTPTDALRFTRGKFFYKYNKLSQNELSKLVGSDLYSKIKPARGLRTAGIVCTTIGSVTAVTGAIFSRNQKAYGNNGVDPGTAVCIGGVAILGSGIAMLCVGNHRIKNVVQTFNLNNGRQLSLAPATSGLGVALRF